MNTLVERSNILEIHRFDCHRVGRPATWHCTDNQTGELKINDDLKIVGDWAFEQIKKFPTVQNQEVDLQGNLK